MEGNWLSNQMSYSPPAIQDDDEVPIYNFKILVPAAAVGAIMGKGGETILQLQKDAGAKIKMSRSNDFYPGTTERVCLISGPSVEGILRIHEFIMDKIKEKPDPNSKVAIDFDHKLSAEREKQVKILVPNSTAGMIIGKGGSFIKQIKEESGAYVQISQKSKEHALAERCITVIGELENNKKACGMIITKIMEDPQSGSCLNLSYSDVTGPVANFNPIGSPYANTTGGNSSQSSSHHHHHQSNVTNSNASYSSNGSLNSLSPTLTNSLTNSFSSPQGQGQSAPAGSMMQFSGMNLAPAMTNNSAQLIESIKAMLRVSGYSEEAVSDICSAMNTLANYGMLGLGLGLQGMFNGLNAQPMFNNLSMPLPGNQAGPPQHTNNNCAADLSALSNTVANNGHQHLYSSTTGVQNLDCGNNVPTVVEATSGSSARSAGSNNLFGPVGSSTSAIANLNHSATSGSPNGNRSTHNVSDGLMPDNFDPFRRSSPSLGSPGSASGPNQVVNGTSSVVSGPNGGHQLQSAVVNNNSFGLGTTVLNTSGSSPLRKSPTQNEHGEMMANVEVEIGDNIVGAILGHKGTSIVEIQRISGANIQISKKGIFAPGTRNRIVTISGTPNSVSAAQYLIEQQLSVEEAKRRQNAPTLNSVLR